MTSSRRAAAVSLGGLYLWAALGCDRGGPTRYDVSGTITFNGSPIPAGQIVLNADHQAGNKGPQGRAGIVNGQISIEDDMGTVAGPQWLQISGYDGQSYKDNEGLTRIGKELFPRAYKQVELPKRDMKLNIRVTPAKSAAEKPSVDVEILE
jgi:hypothetical protein